MNAVAAQLGGLLSTRLAAMLLLAIGEVAPAVAGPFAFQSTAGLSGLTVPTRSLPAGCRLEPVPKDANGETRFVMDPGLRENPWIGSKGVTPALIREVVEGFPRYDSGLTRAEVHALTANQIAEGYRARYRSADGGAVDVWAVRFYDSALTARAAIRRLDGAEQRIVFGATAVRVYWSGQNTATLAACYRAVRNYIAALK